METSDYKRYERIASLLLASTLGDKNKIQQLLNDGVNVNATNVDGRTALHVSACEGNFEIVALLINFGADASIRDRWGNTPMQEAIVNGHGKLSEYLRKEGSSIDTARLSAKLCYSASSNNLPMIKNLLSGGASTELVDYDRRTPLHLAAAEGHIEIVQLLVSKGASLNPTDRWSCTPLTDAIRNNRLEVVKFLKNSGGISVAHPNSEVLMLCDAATNGDIKLLEDLIAKGINPNDCDYDKRTALHLACSEGYFNVVKLLVNKKASVDNIDRWGRSPLDDAIDNSHHEIVEYLESIGATRGQYTLGSPTWQIDPSQIQIEEKIGNGSYGTIFKAKWRGLHVAVKQLRMDLGDRLQEASEDITREISLMSTLRHPNLVMFFGACVKHQPFSVVFEHLSGGDLEDLLRKNIPPFERVNKRKCIGIAHEIALGMAYLHGQRVIHRDLKPSIFDSKNVLLIADFGLSRFFPQCLKKNHQKYRMTGGTGSYRYMAPEVFRWEKYDETVDVYSYAMIMWFVCTNRRPFGDVNADKAAHGASDGDRPSLKLVDIPVMKQIISNGWDPLPEKRPSFQKIVEELSELVQTAEKCCIQ